MELNKVDAYIAANGAKFPAEKIVLLRDQLRILDDSRFPVVQSVELRDPTTLLIVSILVGSFGIDRFMLGEVGLGVAKLLTCGGMGIWTIVDWFTVSNRTKELNFQKIVQYTV